MKERRVAVQRGEEGWCGEREEENTERRRAMSVVFETPLFSRKRKPRRHKQDEFEKEVCMPC